jgi:phage host-nuclease inhibitor protein Gam
MSRRTRIETPALQSRDDVDGAIREIGGIDIGLERIDAVATNAINRIKSKAGTKAAPLLAQKKLLLRQLQQWAEGHREEFGDKKSLSLLFGELGWRASTRLKKILSPVQIVERVKSLLLDWCIRVKYEVDIEAVKALPEEVIEAAGCELEKIDAFWVQPDRQKIEEARK